jgi:hypothetical protein
MMVHGGDGYAGGVEMEVGGEQLHNRGIDRNCVLGRFCRGTGRVRLDGGNEANAQPGCFQFAVDTKMVAAKGSGPGNGDAQIILAGYLYAPFPSTALRQRV